MVNTAMSHAYTPSGRLNCRSCPLTLVLGNLPKLPEENELSWEKLYPSQQSLLHAWPSIKLSINPTHIHVHVHDKLNLPKHGRKEMNYHVGTYGQKTCPNMAVFAYVATYPDLRECAFVNEPGIHAIASCGLILYIMWQCIMPVEEPPDGANVDTHVSG